jgi:hypothetical protein
MDSALLIWGRSTDHASRRTLIGSSKPFTANTPVEPLVSSVPLDA